MNEALITIDTDADFAALAKSLGVEIAPIAAFDLLPADGLLGVFAFEEGAGATVADVLGGGAVTLAGGISWDGTGKGVILPGTAGAVLTFPVTVDTDFEYLFLYKFTGGAFARLTGSGATNQYGIDIYADATFNNGAGRINAFAFKNGGGTSLHATLAGVQTSGRWLIVSVSRSSGGTFRVELSNGLVASDVADPNFVPNAQPLRFGLPAAPTGPGRMAGGALYDRQLSADERLRAFGFIEEQFATPKGIALGQA